MENYRSANYGGHYSTAPWDGYRNRIKSIVVNDGISFIGRCAFYGLENVISIQMPESVTRIEEMAFCGCISLEEIDLSHVLSIENNAFNSCESLKSVALAEGLTKIHYQTFEASGLKSVALPSSLKYIAASAFDNSKINYIFFCGSREEWYSIRECDGDVGQFLPTGVVHFNSTGHCWDHYVVDVEPSCANEGIESLHCSVCDLSDITTNRSIPKTDTHVWNVQFTMDQKATCTTDGQESIHCSICDAIDKTSITRIPALGHSFDEWIEVLPSTCEGEGIHKHTCDVCGFTESKSTDPKGHEWDDKYSLDVPATCTTDGSESIHCKNCDVTKDSKVIPANGHQWNTEYTVDKAATCTEKGSESIHCSRCDAIKDNTSRTIQEKSHSYGRWTTTKAPTYTEVGSKEKVCSKCGDKVTESIPKLKRTGWHKIDGEWYYFRSDGEKATNAWAKDSGGWYWMNGSGRIARNVWAKDSGGWYWMNGSGRIAKNAWAKDSKGWCWMGSNGRMVKSKWVKYRNDWYYLNASGYMVTGTQKIGGKTYRFDKSGKWIS